MRFFACVFVFLCVFEGTWGYPFQIGLKGSQRKLGPQFDTEAHDASATQLDLTRLKSSFSFAVSELDGYPPGEAATCDGVLGIGFRLLVASVTSDSAGLS